MASDKANLSPKRIHMSVSDRSVQPTARFLIAVILAVLVLTAQPAGYAFTNDQAAALELGQSGFTTSTEATSETGLSYPHDLVFDSHGNLWVVDSANSRVLEYVPPFSDGMAASLVLGQPNWTSNESATSQTGLSFPWGLALDSHGDLWVADDANSRVLEYVPPFSDGMAASLVLGQSSFTTNTPATSQTGLSYAGELVFDSQGNLWVSDHGNNRFVEYVPGTFGCPRGQFCTDMDATLVIGQSSWTSSRGTTSRTGLHIPFGLTFDSHGNLWAADWYNNRVLEYVPPFSDDMPASLVLGQSSFTTHTIATSRTGLYRPEGLVFDSQGNLWVADEFNSRVLEYVVPVTVTVSYLVIGGGSSTTATKTSYQTGTSTTWTFKYK
jgi:sugar lactone lactonase YvrE